ncbi:anaerobic sulfatase maturase [Vibrio sp. WXL103]|uniref:anaerobic sulfatase maturase n=1 Tax=Vibrio sp. WXL103 TaxID=3450710 RepID=UPI003EC6B049
MTQRSPHPFHLIVKPVGAKCNLDCNYCYYLNKAERYEPGATMLMSDELLEKYTRDYISAQPADARHIEFSWQGGEPTLRGIEFFEKAVALQNNYLPENMTCTNNFQTNGTLINDRWASFFKQHNFLVGISIDGDEDNHGPTRPNLNGTSSHGAALRGLKALKAHNVMFNTLSVVHSDNAGKGKQTYQYLKGLGSSVMQFQPCVEDPVDRRGDKDWSLTAAQWGNFLCDVFDEWKKADVGKVHVQLFENILLILAGQQSQMCFHSPVCGQQLMLEHDGSLYSCDHFSYDHYRIGHLDKEDAAPLGAMVSDKRQIKFGTDKWSDLPTQCRQCPYLALCNGGCPKHRTAYTADLEPNLNQLCSGYKQFFIYAMPYFAAMLNALNQGHSAAMYPLFLKL